MSKESVRFVCECGTKHPHKIINSRDYLKLASNPLHGEHGVFIERENCKFRGEDETVLAKSGKLVLVRDKRYSG